MNSVNIIGRLGKDPELTYAVGNRDPLAVCRFTVAVQKNKAEEVDFFPVTYFGKRAETIAKYFRKGDQIGVSGRLENSTYKKNDTSYIRTSIIGENFDFCEKKRRKEDAPAMPDLEIDEDGFYNIPEGELPFNMGGTK